MGAIYTQPQYLTAVDWSNPLTRGLYATMNPVANSAVDAVSRKNWTLASGAINTIPTQLGNALSGTMRLTSGNLDLNNDFTIFYVGRNGPDVYSLCVPISIGGMWMAPYQNELQITGTKIGRPCVANANMSAAVVRSGSSYYGWVDGIRGPNSVPLPTQAGPISIMAFSNNSVYYQGSMALALIWKRGLSDQEVKLISDNPWQIFKAPQRRIWVAVGSSAAALAGNSAAQANAQGSLTTKINIAAAALSFATAGGSLTTAIPLDGIAVSTASASGTPTTEVRIAADALAQALASAAMSSGIILTTAAVAQAAAQGSLSTIIQMIASAAAQASAPASLTASGSGIAADAQALASANAALTIQIQLAAAALASATSSAALGSGITLATSAAAQASAPGALTTQITITATALAEAVAVGGLIARIDLATHAIGTTDASAWLLTAVRLAADASVIAAASAALTGGAQPVLRYQALTADAFPTMLTADAFPTMLTAEIY